MRITKLDGLRGVFSIMIVFFHYREAFLPEYLHQFFFIREAYTFVDFFFVLSGYVIAYNYHSLATWDEFKLYLKKRFIRLFPLLFFTATLALGLDIIGNYFFPSMVDNVDTLPVLLLRYMDTLCFTNSSPILGSTSGMNGVSWSISSEMISYIVFGLISIIAIKKNNRGLLLGIVIITSILFAVYNGSYINTGDYGFIRGLISFNLGYFVWKISRLNFNVPNIFEYLIPILLLVIFYVLNKLIFGFQKEMLILAIVPIFFASAILVLLKTNGLLSKILSSKPLVFLGDISYSIYLNHFLLVLILPRLFFGMFKLPQNNFTQLGLFILIIAFVIIFSNLTYKYIEKKGSRLLRDIILK
ncbi:acyltransferase family protein [Maribacter forsetii]|uniref:acyltransferase family protein n=1 Tax=Maribacter forsetii TaxID=444515 RepID=UPI00055B1DA7|nr:acyltransferase [Maribacter forsetii]